MTAEKPNRDLLALRDWCHKQAACEHADPLWARIADEVDDYLLGEPAVQTEDHDALF